MRLVMLTALTAGVVTILAVGQVSAGDRATEPKLQSSPSFNCAQARTRVEHLICGDDYLGRLDRDMARSYAAFRQRISARERVRLRDDQRRWIADRNRCTTVDCLIATYEDRIAYLDGSGRY